MNLLWLFLALSLLGFVFSKVEPFLALPAYGLNALAAKGWKPIFYFVAALGLLWQTYVLLAWSVLALLVTQLLILRPGVVHHWPYYVLGFAECLATPMHMASYEYINHPQPPDALREFKTLTIIALVGGGFIAFGVWPILALPWCWFLRLL
jgi:hypothetical protein